VNSFAIHSEQTKDQIGSDVSHYQGNDRDESKQSSEFLAGAVVQMLTPAIHLIVDNKIRETLNKSDTTLARSSSEPTIYVETADERTEPLLHHGTIYGQSD
jgi:hypothetical protein